ncbi:hypothetical protein FACS1894147_04720 [Spirochaetia bacterium]|nr:hypothetical protein FACS1894147_04720 [Spirochaetia bacterium]
MGTLAGRLQEIRAKTGGNRESTGWEQGTGVPEEIKYRVTPPDTQTRRILGQLAFAIELSEANGGGFTNEIGGALDILEKGLDKEGVLTRETCKRAEEAILPLQKAAKEYTVLFASHAHIDMNWMWSWQETVQSALATFRTMLALMKEYPDFTFSQSQASCYRLVEEYDPELMEEIKARIKEGRWEVTASAWVETDKNMPNTESLLRHIRYTKNYLESVWGVKGDSLNIDFSPDTFGHSAHIPEIDNYGGVKYFYHCRGLEERQVLYRWKSPSGAELLGHCEPYWYNRGIQDDIALGVTELAALCGGLKTSLIVYGVGDHGGGPTRRDLDRILELAEWPVYPRLRFGTFAEYFKAAETVRDKLPVVDREVNFIFTGCYTTQSRIKLGNRRSEAALLDAEVLDAMSGLLTGKRYPAEKLEQSWRKVLFNHFHDILTGSCVRDSRDYAMANYSEALATAGTAREKAGTALAAAIDTSLIALDDDGDGRADRGNRAEGAGAGFGIENFGGIPSAERGRGCVRIYHVFNPSAHKRRELVEFTLWDWDYDLKRAEFTSHDGKPLSFQLVDKEPVTYWDHRYIRFLGLVEVPAGGYTTVIWKEKAFGADYPHYFQGFPRSETIHGPVVLENDFLRAEFDTGSGALVSLKDKADDRELITARAGINGGGLVINWAEKRTNNAWNTGRYLRREAVTGTVRLTPDFTAPHSGELRNGFTMEQEVLGSKIKTHVYLDKDAKALAYDFVIDWNEAAKDHKNVPVLCFSLPLAAEPAGPMAAYQADAPAGTMKRPSAFHDIPGLQYAAAVAGSDALALITDCKYGYRGCEGVLSATLINTAASPDPYPERGEHVIKLWVAMGESDPKKLSEAAGDFCHPMSIIPGSRHKGSLPPVKELLRLDAASTVLSSAGLTADGSLLIRLYETAGKKDTVTITTPLDIAGACLEDLDGKTAGACSPKGNTVSFEIAPYKIQGLKLKLRR